MSKLIGSYNRCLITGASGYIGERLARSLTKSGLEVHLLGRRAPPDWPSTLFHFFDGSFGSIAASLKVASPDIVFHLASAVAINHGPEDVDEIIRANVTFPALILEAMRYTGCSRLVGTGTHWQHFDGSVEYHPVNLYAATKQAEQDIARLYAESFGINISYLKLFDVYGPLDHRPKLIPYLIRGVLNGQILELSPGLQEIDLVHVDDVVEAYCVAARRLLNPPSSFEVFAVRSGRVLSLRDLVLLIETIYGRSLNVAWGIKPYRVREVMKAPAELETLPGWKPQVALEDGLLSLS